MALEINKINYIDCLDVENGLWSLPNNSVDICFFDPPYNAKKDYGNYKDNLSTEEYIISMRNVVKECKRISKKGVGVYIDSWRFKTWWQMIFPKSEPIIIWKRTPGFPSSNNIITSFHVILTNIKAIKRVKSLWNDLHPVADGLYWRLTRDYVSETHPAQTSYEIVERFISNFSEKGNIILDPFMGTGTTAECCIKLKRKYWGYEINPEYKNEIEKRLGNIITTEKTDFSRWL